MAKQLVILITGATSGIGRHAALELARRGHQVIASGRRQSALDALAVEAEGTRLSTMRLDVTDRESIEAARRAVERDFGGRLDVLINNAGYGLIGPLQEIDDAALRRQYDTNVFGLMAMTRAFLPLLLARGEARILNVTSVGGRMTFPFMGAYNSTKYAVESMSDALRVELAAFGVDVVLIEPGPINTEFSDVAYSSVAGLDVETSPYRRALQRSERLKGMFDKLSAGPEVTTRAIVRAIEARRPRARYIAPFREYFTLLLVSILPTRLVDWFFAKMLGHGRGSARKALPGLRQGAPEEALGS